MDSAEGISEGVAVIALSGREDGEAGIAGGVSAGASLGKAATTGAVGSKNYSGANGISAVIDPLGRMIWSLPLGSEGLVDARVAASDCADPLRPLRR